MKSYITVGNRKIGENQPVFVVAELSSNHMQRFETASRLIEMAKKAGASAVKMQTYTPDTLTLNVCNKYFRIKRPNGDTSTLYEFYKKAYTPWRWFKRLKKLADEIGIIFFSTAFDKTAVDFLEELKVPIHKIASFELVDLPLIEYVAKTKKPLILSTGMATVSEIKEAVNTARNAGAKDIILLKCVSSYPAKPQELNLKTIPDMKRMFNCPIGFSDHTMGIGASIAAVSLGAKIIEKHFTLSRRIETSDTFFSIEPQEFQELVDNVRITEKALGKVHYGLTDGQKRNRIFRRSLFVVKDIKKGEIFTEENVRSIRPGHGLPPKDWKIILSKQAARDIKRGTPLKKGYVRNN